MNSDESIQKIESSDDKPIDLTRLSGYEILELAKGKYGKRDGGDRSKWLIHCVIDSIQWDEIKSFIRAAKFIFGPMLVDPLFLYLPIINENIKCLMFDEKLKTITIVLRSFTDLLYLYPVLRTWGKWWKWSFLEDLLDDDDGNEKRIIPIFRILAILPIPHIIILIFLPTITMESRSLNRMKFWNSLFLLQYVARAYPVYRVCKDVNRCTRENSKEFAKYNIIWIIGALNFIAYILASHVLGAFWYFFSVQRLIDCWISTCQSKNGCGLSTLQCNTTMFKNVTLLDDMCPTNPPNTTVHDFGIFVDALQSHVVGTTDFPQKLWMCFSWGIRNLSSFASNLNSSTYAWESIFVIFISISGLVLFIYLLGHVQTFMQAISRKSDIQKQMRGIYQQIELMLHEYGLRAEVKDAIEKLVREALEEDDDLVVENIFSVLPPDLKVHIKCHLFLATLKKVPGLENKDRQVLDAIMEELEPVNYADGSYIIREGEPLDRMLFITQGSVLTYKTSSIGGESGSSSIIRLAKSEFYGEELIGWAVASTSVSDLPISAKTVKSCNTVVVIEPIKSSHKVEVFVLVADRLQLVVSKFKRHFNTELPQTADSTPVEISIS